MSGLSTHFLSGGVILSKLTCNRLFWVDELSVQIKSQVNVDIFVTTFLHHILAV